ncbi:non-homologous end-joining DNA ligase [Mycobacterium malmoense]|uniref:ATP-dependent DNA ligase n=1 Tax=Mycobacterium malmoense TaxID=1780 RepID=A0ABX3SQN7_MYCMA|nr:non-homologous end-joining DNA ligase [Mycobacterium malmoense]ORA80419.1 ATP-dependent DNA ligase [Mycobacterium malmoense]QZA19618.1 non-homologous end-joining DNA ligase [Mycobacterium malmoense]UNB96370.1 ATP-dependent DNA ligase [Mycobacterium malmoense]
MARIEVEVTHPDRVMFPDPSSQKGITKGDLVDYYGEVADTMLPHLKDRPLSVQRFPRGIGEQGFVQQDFADSLPDWIGRVEVAREGGAGGTVVHPVAERPEALRWLANQNCVALHVWQSRRGRLHNPDRLVFDLDPSDTDFEAVRATARAVAGVLDDLGLARYVQTTGSRGLHVVVPLRPDTDFDAARQFARDVAELVVADDPAHRTVEARKDKRGRRVYLDVMRNAYAQTAVAPYSVRARAGAPVATPLEWDELDSLNKRSLRSDRFTVRNILKRLAGQRDPWADMYRHARSLTGPTRRLAKLRA